MIAMFTVFFASTAIFVQSQLKYGAERDSYLHKWYERPLHQNTAYADKSDGSFLNPAAWRKTVETLRYGKIDGITFFASRLGERWDVFGKSLLPGCETRLLATLSGSKGRDGYIKAAERALSAPNSYRVNGKCVLTVRGGIEDSCGETFLKDLKRTLVDRFGDKFMLLPHGNAFTREEYNNGNPVPEAILRAKENLRCLLRAGDGYVYMMYLEGLVERRYDRDLFERTVAKVIGDVFAEDEFKGKKLLGMHFNGGHLNSYRWQYNCDADGTATLCDRFETAVSLSPDIVILGEWDEENENTHFRPTVTRGNSYVRIVRHFADRLAGREPVPAPGEDASVPNILLSYRKALVAGETAEVEVRNIPDGSFKGRTFRISFAWRDAAGNAVVAYPAKTLDADVQSAVRFSTPAAGLVSHRILTPFLRVEWDGGSREYSEGLYRMGVRAVRNVDHMWVVHSLRDFPSGVSGEIDIGEPDADGVRLVRGKVSSPSMLRSVEVLDDMGSAYVHSTAPAVPAGHEQICVSMTGFFGNRTHSSMVNGSIRFVGAPGAVLKGSADRRRKVAVKDGAWRFKDIPCDNWGLTLWAAVPRAEMADGALEVDLPPHFSGRVKLSDLLEREVVGFNSSDSCGLSVMRFLPVAHLPRPLQTKRAEFEFRWRPLEKTSVLRLRAVDEGYRVWNGPARTVYSPSGRNVPVAVYDRNSEKTVSLELDENRLDGSISCDLANRKDSVLRLTGGRMLTGMVGASAALAQGFGRGESHYGNPLAESKKYYLKGGGEMMPKDGWGCLSLQTLPCYAGFELTMKVKPNGFGSRQGLFGTGNCGLDVTLEPDGTVRALFSGGNLYMRKMTALSVPVKGNPLKDGEWNVVKVGTDRRTAWVEVNGVRGEPVAYSDYFFNQRYALFGVTLGEPNFFKGEMASLSVEIK